jgi:undecaprenyl pyrophosphate phosphatase UppP
MAPITAENETSRVLRFTGIFMAVLVTANVGVRVSKHWRTYDLFDKGNAVFVLVALAAFPCIAIWRERKSGKKVELFEMYLLMLLVIGLFR